MTWSCVKWYWNWLESRNVVRHFHHKKCFTADLQNWQGYSETVRWKDKKNCFTKSRVDDTVHSLPYLCKIPSSVTTDKPFSTHSMQNSNICLSRCSSYDKRCSTAEFQFGYYYCKLRGFPLPFGSTVGKSQKSITHANSSESQHTATKINCKYCSSVQQVPFEFP